MSSPGQAGTRVPLRHSEQSEMIENQTNKFFEMETINYSNCYQNHIVSIEFQKFQAPGQFPELRSWLEFIFFYEN